MEELFRHRGHEVFVWTTVVHWHRFIWTYSIDDGWLGAPSDSYSDEQAALDAGHKAAIERVDRLETG